MKNLKKVISGGQVGADLGGLAAAKSLCIPTGGFAPQGYRTANGVNLELRDIFGLIECPTSDYKSRTYLNVLNSDATLRFAGDFDSPGEKCTLGLL
jgi:hypothetical protein